MQEQNQRRVGGAAGDGVETKAVDVEAKRFEAGWHVSPPSSARR